MVQHQGLPKPKYVSPPVYTAIRNIDRTLYTSLDSGPKEVEQE